MCPIANCAAWTGTFIKRYYCERNVFWKVSLGNGAVIKKEVFTKLNIWFDKNVTFEDLDFGLRVVKDHPWIGIPEVLRSIIVITQRWGIP